MATDPEIAERARTVARLLDGLGHFVEELEDRSICDWTAPWSAYTVGWTGSRTQFAETARERGLDPGRLGHYLGLMVYCHYVAAERYDKFDVWKIDGRQRSGHPRVRPADGRL